MRECRDMDPRFVPGTHTFIPFLPSLIVSVEVAPVMRYQEDMDGGVGSSSTSAMDGASDEHESAVAAAARHHSLQQFMTRSNASILSPFDDPLFGRRKELEQIAQVADRCAQEGLPFFLVLRYSLLLFLILRNAENMAWCSSHSWLRQLGVSAPGGFGKTKLAYAAWNILLNAFSGPKLWARLRGHHTITVGNQRVFVVFR